MGTGGTSTVGSPALRMPRAAAAPWRAALIAAAAACALIGVVAAAASALGIVYVAVRVVGKLVAGEGDDAARWAPMAFAAAAPLLVAYVAHAGYAGSLARLRGEARARPSVLAVAAPAAVIALAVGMQGALAAKSFFVTDDWFHIAVAHDAVTGSGLTIHYLSRIVFIHYAPGHRLAYYLLDKFAPLDWGAALTVMLVLFAGSLFFFQRICRRLFGPRRSNLVLLGLFGTSVLLVPSFLWFADALHKFPSMLMSLIAIDAYLAHRLERRRGALLVAVVAVSVGSLFYAKALLVPLYMVLISVLFLERRPDLAPRIVWRERWTWLAFAPTFLIYGVNYVLNYANQQATSPSLHLLGKYLWIAWFRGVTPAFVGVHVTVDAPPSQVLWAIGAQVLLIAVVALTVYRKRSAWRAWLFWAIAFGANATVVGLGRLGSLGLHQVGSQLRYDTEMTWLLPLALGFAFFPGEVAGREGEASVLRRRVLRWPRRRLRIALVALAACAYLAATIDTGHDTAAQWRLLDSGQPKAYVANMQRDAARLQRSGVSLETMDDQTPAYLIAPPHKPWNRLERLVPAIAPQLRVVPAAAHPLQIRQDGEVIPIALQSLASGSASITGSGKVTLAGGHRSGRACAVAGAAPATLGFATETLFRGESLFARLDYSVPRTSTRPALVSANSYRGHPLPVALGRPRGHLYVNLGHRLSAQLPPGSEVCLRSAGVGWLAP